MSQLVTLLDNVDAAQKAAEAELMRLYPRGSTIHFTIMHGQRNASTGVVCCPGYRAGYVRVQHNEAKPGSRYAYRDIHHTNVLP